MHRSRLRARRSGPTLPIVSEPEQYARYRADAEFLRAVGRVLRDTASTTADLPSPLAEAALAAWSRDEQQPLAPDETAEQRQVRMDAATLALIGLAVENARSQGVPVTIHSETLAEAIAAADRV